MGSGLKPAMIVCMPVATEPAVKGQQITACCARPCNTTHRPQRPVLRSPISVCRGAFDRTIGALLQTKSLAGLVHALLAQASGLALALAQIV